MLLGRFRQVRDPLLEWVELLVLASQHSVRLQKGLKVTGDDKSRTVVLGGLRANQTYHAVLSVEDSEGE